jgi:GH25 family lysozyme M1 (1,4-beta-N-acetylmuramidase)
MRKTLGLLLVSSMVVGCAGEVPDDAVAGDNLRGDAADELTGRARVCADGPTLTGVDVSFYQETIDWAKVKNAGVSFAFIRVSDGLSYPDSRFAANWAGAKNVGIVRGAYQFFRPNQDPTAQADLLVDAIGTLAPGDLPPVIDIEATGGQSAATIVARAQVWADRVEARLGVRPIVYTGKYFWQDNVGSSAKFVDHPLWVAQYTSQCPDLPTPWTRWAFWQYTDKGSIPGIPGGVDMNRFNGSLADLQALARKAPSAPIEVYWAREASGTYQLRALAPAEITRVEYLVDGYAIGGATRADGDNFPDSYAFSLDKNARLFEVRGFDAAGKQVGLGVGSIDVTAGTAVAIRQLGAALYEVSLERAPAGVAAIEVRADGTLLTDATSGATRSPRLAVRSSFLQLGQRTFTITTYDATGKVRGTLTRTFTLR